MILTLSKNRTMVKKLKMLFNDSLDGITGYAIIV